MATSSTGSTCVRFVAQVFNHVGRTLIAGSLITLASTACLGQKVPEGFKSELIMQVPEIEHPSVVTCDDEGNLFVGEDPMDMRGPTTEPIDRVIYLRWSEDGGPPEKTVFCDGLSAVFGLVWYDGALYVMHAPHYSVFRDTDGDGVADERKDLAEGFGPPAGVFGFNDHIVTGTRLGLDGLIYVSVGDKGIQRATGADGSTITLEGGGVVRMRPDGTELEIISSGTRNHLDVAMDSLDNIFTYDNTDDGLGWWTRFTHHIPSGYYGYPYDYHDHPERHLPRISEHGGGSPCGAACYRGAAWPERYVDSAFFCEWGKGKVQRFSVKPDGATFTAEIEDFMTNDGTGDFRPEDLCFSPDGRIMYVADWNFGGWTQPEQRGRLYRVTYVGDDLREVPPADAACDDIDALIDQLAHPNYQARRVAQTQLAKLGQPAAEALSELLKKDDVPAVAKVHAIWAQNALIDQLDGYSPAAEWIALLKDPNLDIRGQAARALGLRRVQEAAVARPLADKAASATLQLPDLPLVNALKDEVPSVRLRAAIALGRIGGPFAYSALWEALADDDRYVSFAAMQGLRALGKWSQAGMYLDHKDERLRQAALVTLTGQYDSDAVEELSQTVAKAKHADARAGAVAALAEVYRQADPYESGWWGTQPARNPPARPKKNEWSGTPIVIRTLMNALEQDSPEVREAAATAFATIDHHPALPVLRAMASGDENADVRRAVIETLVALRDEQTVSLLANVAADTQLDDELRSEAVAGIMRIGSDAALGQLTALIADQNTSPDLIVMCMEAVAKLESNAANEAIRARLQDKDASVRAMAAKVYAGRRADQSVADLLPLLEDPETTVRQAVLLALGQIRAIDTVPQIIVAAADEATEFEALSALAMMADPRALPQYLTGLAHRNQTLRDASRAALTQIREEIAEELIALHGRNELPQAVIQDLQIVYSTPAPVLSWHVLNSWAKPEVPEIDFNAAPDFDAPVPVGDETVTWRVIDAQAETGRVALHRTLRPRDSSYTLAYLAIPAASDSRAQLQLGSDDQVTLWVNGDERYSYGGSRGWAADQATVDVDLHKGVNHVWLLLGNDGGPWEFSMHVGQRDPRFAFLDQTVPPQLNLAAYVDFATEHAGDPKHGEQLFNDAKGIGCVKCHAVDGSVAKAGPDLRGVGTKYPRPELMRSILEPSSRILSGYELSVVITGAGQVYQGVVKRENEETVELIDVEGKSIIIPADEVDEIERSTLSMMPNGLKDGMSLQDFADIVAYLGELKETEEPTGGP